MCFVGTLDPDINGHFLTCFGLGVVGIHVEGRTAGNGSYDAADMNDTGDILMLDGSGILVYGSIVELGNNGGKVIVAFGCIIADDRGNGEDNAVCAEARVGHHNA